MIANKKELNKIVDLIINNDKVKQNKIILLSGHIGSGKTHLIKYFSKHYLKSDDVITSPTFNQMSVYEHMVHIDAYNLTRSSLEKFEDFFEDKWVFIEWYENLVLDENNYLKIDIKFINENKREYILK